MVGFSFEVKDDETIKIFINKTADNTYAYVITKGSEELITGSMKADVTSTEKSDIRSRTGHQNLLRDKRQDRFRLLSRSSLYRICKDRSTCPVS